jgi:hypothetical protein
MGVGSEGLVRLRESLVAATSYIISPQDYHIITTQRQG